MAGPMRERPGDREPPANNFEYDEQEWDIGIGDLIIDLDADIEKSGGSAMASAASGAASKAAKLAVEHSATVDKGLKMKIKRTKPGTKTSEAKHEIVKSNEQQNGGEVVDSKGGGGGGGKHAPSGGSSPASSSKRGSSGHRRDKVKEKPAKPTPNSNSSNSNSSSGLSSSGSNSSTGSGPAGAAGTGTAAVGTVTPLLPDVNGVSCSAVRAGGVPSASPAPLSGTVPVGSTHGAPAPTTPLTAGATPPGGLGTPGGPGTAGGPGQQASHQAPPRTTVFTGASGPGPPGLPAATQHNDTDRGASQPPPTKKVKANSESKVSDAAPRHFIAQIFSFGAWRGCCRLGQGCGVYT